MSVIGTPCGRCISGLMRDVYTDVMTKRLVDIDDSVLDEARAALGTDTIKETVNTALTQATALAARREHLQRFKADQLPDLREKKVMAQAWR